MRDYREKTIVGMIGNIRTGDMLSREVTVRMTSDKIGQSLSLQCANVLIEIPLEPVKNIIKVSDREDGEME